MATKRPKSCPPVSLVADADTPGVWAIDRPGRPMPFGVQWRELVWDPITKQEKREKRTEFFSSASDRDKRRARLYADKLAGRTGTLTREEQEEWRAFTAATGGLDWRSILANHQAWLEHTGAGGHTTLIRAFHLTYVAFCQQRVDRREMSKASLKHKTGLLKKFAASFGQHALQHAKAPDVETWLDSLGNESPATFNSHRKILFAFFNEARLRGLITHNPLLNLRRRRAVVDNRKRIITPQQTAQLFHTALTIEKFRPLLLRLALEAFLGIRFSSAYRLTRDNVRVAERAIMLPAAELKTGMESGEGHYVDDVPEQVWEWVAVAPAAGWALTPRQYLELKSQLFLVAQVPHPPNCLRKNFASYDLAAHKNPGRTAWRLAHQNQRKLWADYKGNSTTEAGRLYQRIAPQTCLAIARGEPLPAPDPRQTTPAPPGESASGDRPAPISSTSDSGASPH